MSGRAATRANSHFACFSSGDVLLPLGFALALRVSRRCNHLTAELALRPKLSAASRRDAPASTASITRSRKSSSMLRAARTMVWISEVGAAFRHQGFIGWR
jgi:hypothetical protein